MFLFPYDPKIDIGSRTCQLEDLLVWVRMILSGDVTLGMYSFFEIFLESQACYILIWDVLPPNVTRLTQVIQDEGEVIELFHFNV